MKKQTVVLAQSGILIAMIIVAQYLGRLLPASALPAIGFGAQQLITGSIVNLILVVSAAMVGLYAGITVGALSATTATLLGIGGVPHMLPVIILGNATIVVVSYLFFEIAKKQKGSKALYNLFGVIVGAAAKCAVIWILAANVVIPTLVKSDFPQKAINMLTLNFSWPQAVTALIGGLLAISILPVLKKSVKQ